MISHHVYKVIHLTGVFLLLIALGGQLVETNSSTWRKHLKVSHGFGLLFLLIAGFGLIARLGIGWPFPVWIHLKILVWIVLGSMPVLMRIAPSPGKLFWWMILGLAVFSAYLANFKPFI